MICVYLHCNLKQSPCQPLCSIEAVMTVVRIVVTILVRIMVRIALDPYGQWYYYQHLLFVCGWFGVLKR